MSDIQKIISMDELSVTIDKHRGRQKVAFCNGVFDFLHIGTLRFLKEAKKRGDILAVSIISDALVRNALDIPTFKEDLRAEALAAFECVDYIAINSFSSLQELLEKLRPDCYVHPSAGGTPQEPDEELLSIRQLMERWGGELFIIEDGATGSHRLNEQFREFLPQEARDYLDEFAKRYEMDEILKYLHEARKLRILVVGETIIDEYHRCEAIGKSEKEPVLATRFLGEERFLGGSLAVARHLSGFCNNVGLISFLGEDGDDDEFIRSRLNKTITPVFLKKKNSPTLIKRRFIDHIRSQKLFEVYYMNDEPLCSEDEKNLHDALSEHIGSYDLVLVVDYGHGMLTERNVELLCEKSPFLAVNSQANAGNKGYNVISKYGRADFISLAKHEITLDARNKWIPLEEVACGLAGRMGAEKLIVTCGKNGSLGYQKGKGFCRVPALSHTVKDSIGAGDAVLSITSLCAVQKAPIEIMCLLGNATGAIAITIPGNKEFIRKEEFINNVRTMISPSFIVRR